MSTAHAPSATPHVTVSALPVRSKVGRARPVLAGAVGTALMVAVFATILTLVRGPAHVLTQFAANWYWLVPIMAGFGLQVGVYSWIRSELARRATAGATAEVAASGGASTVSMVTCCAHHLGEVLPALGLGAVGAFLGAYQAPLVALGLGSNAVGVAHMLATAQKHGLVPEGVLGGRVFALDLKVVRRVIAVLAGVAVVASLTVAVVRTADRAGQRGQGAGADAGPPVESPTPATGPAGKPKAPVRPAFTLREQVREAGGLTVRAKPEPVQAGRLTVIGLALSVHEGSIDFDPAAISTLTDDLGNSYRAVWNGDRPGGHERDGMLRFPELRGDPRRLTLTIRDAWGVPERTFTWALR